MNLSSVAHSVPLIMIRNVTNFYFRNNSKLNKHFIALVPDVLRLQLVFKLIVYFKNHVFWWLAPFPRIPPTPPRRHHTRDIASPDNLSSGYSSSTAELSSFMPMSPDELMDTGDYELYNPRVQGLRARDAAAPMIRSIETPGSNFFSNLFFYFHERLAEIQWSKNQQYIFSCWLLYNFYKAVSNRF